MKAAISGLLILAAMQCSRAKEAAKDAGPGTTSSDLQGLDAGEAATSARGAGPALASVETVDRFLAERFGDDLPRSVEQQAAVAVAEAYLDQMHVTVARPRRYLVRKTSAGWDVSVLSLEALRRAEVERRPVTVVSLVEDHGHLEGVSISQQE